MSEATAANTVSKKAQKKEEKKAKREAKDEIPSSAIRFYLHPQSHESNLKCALVAALLKLEVAGVRDSKGKLCISIFVRFLHVCGEL